MTKIALSDLKPNPFRDLVRLPTKAAKVDVLKQSIISTDFWDNIVARKAPNGSGGYEIAYGHNRLEALRQLKWKSVDIPVRDLPDAVMLKMMANENMEEWGASSDVEMETVRAIVTAFAAGQIELPKVNTGATLIRIAPSFDTVKVKDVGMSGKVYTAQSISDFLGWQRWRVNSSLSALSLVEDDLIAESDVAGLSSFQSATVVRETRRVMKETKDAKLATRIGKHLASGMRAVTGKGKFQMINTDRAKYTADELMREARVERHTKKYAERRDRFNLQKADRQVKEFLDACKVWEIQMIAASKAISKFSPEAKAFTFRRLDKIAAAEAVLRGRFK